MDSIIKAIDDEGVDEIKLLTNNNNKFNKNGRDIIYELYDKNKLSEKRLKFIVEKCSSFLNISSSLIKRLIKEDNYKLFSIIIENLNFFDNEFILNILLLNYKNKTPISNSDLKQQISKYKYKYNSNVNTSRYTCNYYLNNASINKNENMFFFLIRHGVDKDRVEKDKGKTLLFDACKGGNENIVKYLVEHGADINKENMRRKTPLFNACKCRNENVVKYLVEHGADINKERRDGETPLFYACFGGNENIFNYLVEHGADINKEDIDGQTPLFYACHSGNENIFNYLVEHGADINKEKKCGEIPLFNACRDGNENIVKYLVECGADINKEMKMVKHHYLRRVIVEMKI